MKIAHLSDLHLDANNKRINLLNTERLLSYISANNYDHIVISGDITENAEASGFELARKLFKKYGLLDPRKLTVTIGNHDIFGGVHLAEDILKFPSRCRAADFNEKVKTFCYFFRETFQTTTKPAEDRFFPFIKELDDTILIGLNSIAEYSPLKNPFASNGKISANQLEEMQSLLNSVNAAGRKVIAVTHHHFCKDSLDMTTSSGLIWQAIEKQTMKLRNKKRIIKSLKKTGAELVLHGHLHESSAYFRKGLKFLNAGGSILGGNSGTIRFNEIEITGSELNHKIVTLDPALKPDSNPVEFFQILYPFPNRTPARNVISMN